MNKNLIFILILFFTIVRVSAETVSLDPKLPYVFTDDKVVIPVATQVGKIDYQIQVLTANGWGKKVPGTAKAKDGTIEITPIAEGIHIVSSSAIKPITSKKKKKAGEKSIRFLAINPPPKISLAAIEKQLQQNGKKLLSGEPFTILAMGDSVTATGDFEHMLAMMLQRATGNKKIKVVTEAHPGCSVDATVREINQKILPAKPDLGLLMYGLNDQGAFTPLRAYLEQTAYIAKKLQEKCDTDVILLEPTPHINIAIDGKPEKLQEVPKYYAFRTIGFVQALRDLGKDIKVLVSPTFSAIWREGGNSIEAAAKNMWPLYPPHYSKKMESMLETDGKGDTIHPNCLGHLQMAKAVFNTINGQVFPEPLQFKAQSKWTDAGVASDVNVKNISDKQRQGSLHVYPLLNGAFEPDSDIPYNLAPGATQSFKVTWPQAKKPEDLLKFPGDLYLSQENIYIPVVDTSQEQNHVYCATAPMEVDADFVSEGLVVDGNSVPVKLRQGNQVSSIPTTIPKGSKVGRIPLIKAVEVDGKKGYAVAELAYTRFGGALPGEAKIDGKLDEWQDHVWSVLGEPCQARWTKGPHDTRKNKEECYMHWTAKAGKDGIYFAIKGTGNIAKDSFDIYFDTRPPEELGTAGPYFWCGGKFAENGKMRLRKGSSTRQQVKTEGKWQSEGNTFQAEFFVPYALMDLSSWPDSGDLGFSWVWVHKGAGKDGTMRLMWAEDGHPWNTRWYGVIRKVKNKNIPFPYCVRIK